MCGRFNIIDDPSLHALLDAVKVPRAHRNLLFTHYDIRPTQFIDIILPGDRNPTLAKAIWWLVLKMDGREVKPDTKWASFNSRHDKFIDGKVHKIKPQSFRVIIPASGWYEWHGEKGNKQAYLIKPKSGVLAFGGVAKRWETDDGPVYSAAIVTLPGHPKLKHVHEKSIPLLLEEKDCATWLDERIKNDSFRDLLLPKISTPLLVGAVSSTSKPEMISVSEITED